MVGERPQDLGIQLHGGGGILGQDVVYHGGVALSVKGGLGGNRTVGTVHNVHTLTGAQLKKPLRT